MSQHYLHRHLTPAVGEAQLQAYGQSHGPPPAAEPDQFGAREIAFISARDSFYLASLTEAGAPYLQHRGGPVGFLRVLDERTLGFADYGGNRQLLTAGHLRRDPRVALFLMDYPARRRLKIDGEAEVVPLQADPQLVELLGPQVAQAGRWSVSSSSGWRPSTGTAPSSSRPVSRRRSWRGGYGRCRSGSTSWRPSSRA